jgi:hypothetical protein
MGVRLGPVRERRALLEEVVAACIGSALAAAVVMRPVLAAPSKRVYGLPSDPLSEVWRLEQFRSGQIGLVGNSATTMANFPSGAVLRRPLEVTQILYDVPAWLLVHLVTPVLAYNTLVFVGLWITGLATYASARVLRIGVIGSALAASLFVLAPIHLVEAELHVPLSYVAPLPVLLALGILTIAEPSPRRGVLLGVIPGVCGYLNAYLLLVAAVLLGALAVVAAWTAVVDRDKRRSLLVAGGVAAVAAALTLAPLAIVLLAFHGSIAGSVTRSEADVVTFSLRPGSYFERSAGSYIGIVGVILASAGLVFGRVSRSARVAIAIVGLAGLAFSLRPGTSVLGAHPTMPAQLVHDVIPYYRVFGRLEILAALAVAMLAGLAVDRLAGWRPVWAPAAAVLIAAVAIADVVRDPPSPAGDLGSPDPVATWLASGRGPVAEYPLYGFDNYLLGRYLFRQLRHGRPLLNGSIEGTLSAKLAAAAGTPAGATARAALQRVGVRAIVVHPPTELPPSGTGLTLARRFPDGSAGYVLEPAR